jgi:hypothetical protein
LDLANFVDRANVWVIQRGRGAGFAAKAFRRLGIAGKLLGKKFQSDKSAKFEILSFVNHAHTPATELFEDSVVRDGSSKHGGHSPLARDVSCYAKASQSKEAHQKSLITPNKLRSVYR